MFAALELRVAQPGFGAKPQGTLGPLAAKPPRVAAAKVRAALSPSGTSWTPSVPGRSEFACRLRCGRAQG